MRYFPLLSCLFISQLWAEPLVEKALAEESRFRLAVSEQIKNWTTTARFKAHNATQILEQLRWDLQVARQLETVSHIAHSARAQKLGLILPAAIKLFEQDGHKIMQGELPGNLDHYWDTPRQNNAQNLQELAFKAVLFVMLNGPDKSLMSDEFLDNSPIVHMTPLPTNLPIYLNNCSFYHAGELVFIHGGYAFGGQREDARYQRFGLYGKPLGPQDCSSWISKLIGAPEVFSTVDFMAHQHAFLKRNLVPVSVSELSDIQPGLIWVTRNPQNTSGHIVLVLGVSGCGNKVKILEYGRDLPNFEGFGLREVELKPSKNKESAFFRPDSLLSRSSRKA